MIIIICSVRFLLTILSEFKIQLRKIKKYANVYEKIFYICSLIMP